MVSCDGGRASARQSGYVFGAFMVRAWPTVWQHFEPVSDDRDHLYLCAASKNPPTGRVDGVEDFLKAFGRRCPFTIDDVNGPGVHFVASGLAEVILGLLLWHYPGEIEIHWPEGSPRIYWAG